MSETRFTPGPWGLEEHPAGRELTLKRKHWAVGVKVPPGGERMPYGVALVFGGEGVPSPANARLIAAAPDLYAALMAVEWIPDEEQGCLFCPACNRREEFGHTDDCDLAAALAAARAPAPEPIAPVGDAGSAGVVVESDKPNRELGMHYRRRREDADLTMGDMADQLGISVAMVSDMERGRAPISASAHATYLTLPPPDQEAAP